MALGVAKRRDLNGRADSLALFAAPRVVDCLAGLAVEPERATREDRLQVFSLHRHNDAQ